ncbi:YceI family protein [Pseudonocardia sp. GCM10023141]|uniref:YceI family protein n=1 Tax=Pseudonocardia sp. GCM10023141 TaxID=3252653 RepID=UPI00361A376C
MTAPGSTLQESPTAFLGTGRWVIDPRHSALGITGRYLGVLRARAALTGVSGEILVAPGHPAVTARIELAPVSTAPASAPEWPVEAWLRSPACLDPGHRPRLGFRSTAVRSADGGWRMLGDLTLRGAVSTVVLDVEPTGMVQDPDSGRWCARFAATAEVDRFAVGLCCDRDVHRGRQLLGDLLDLYIDVLVVRSGPTGLVPDRTA